MTRKERIDSLSVEQLRRELLEVESASKKIVNQRNPWYNRNMNSNVLVAQLDRASAS